MNPTKHRTPCLSDHCQFCMKLCSLDLPYPLSHHHSLVLRSQQPFCTPTLLTSYNKTTLLYSALYCSFIQDNPTVLSSVLLFHTRQPYCTQLCTALSYNQPCCTQLCTALSYKTTLLYSALHCSFIQDNPAILLHCSPVFYCTAAPPNFCTTDSASGCSDISEPDLQAFWRRMCFLSFIAWDKSHWISTLMSVNLVGKNKHLEISRVQQPLPVIPSVTSFQCPAMWFPMALHSYATIFF